MYYKYLLIAKAINNCHSQEALSSVWPSIRNLLDTDREAFEEMRKLFIDRQDSINVVYRKNK